MSEGEKRELFYLQFFEIRETSQLRWNTTRQLVARKVPKIVMDVDHDGVTSIRKKHTYNKTQSAKKKKKKKKKYLQVCEIRELSQ
jgi:tRNA G37 N-methylase TrmD